MYETYNQIIECKSSSSFTKAWPILFVLNKTDLPKSKWQIDINDVQGKVEKLIGNNEMLITCSAYKNENIDKVKEKH